MVRLKNIRIEISVYIIHQFFFLCCALFSAQIHIVNKSIVTVIPFCESWFLRAVIFEYFVSFWIVSVLSYSVGSFLFCIYRFNGFAIHVQMLKIEKCAKIKKEKITKNQDLMNRMLHWNKRNMWNNSNENQQKVERIFTHQWLADGWKIKELFKILSMDVEYGK